jgi:hypothetical protein
MAGAGGEELEEAESYTNPESMDDCDFKAMTCEPSCL